MFAIMARLQLTASLQHSSVGLFQILSDMRAPSWFVQLI